MPRIVGQRLLRTYEHLLNAGEREWSLTDAQKERLGEHLETEYGTLIALLGDNFHSAVIRMAVQIERIAMILTVMRGISASNADEIDGEVAAFNAGSMDKGENRPYMVDTIYCSDQDYEAAEMIGNKLLLHMASAYRMIDGDAQDMVPEIKPIDQRKVLFEQLNETFERKELIREAKLQGISERTAERWNDKWQEQGQVIKLEHGKYRKVG